MKNKPATLDRDLKIYQDPDLLSKICKHVASGGSAITLAELWGVNFGELMGWIRLDKDRSKAYELALRDRNEWTLERILSELKDLATVDINDIFNPEGGLKPIDDWPKAARAAVVGIEVVEEFEGKGSDKVQTGWNKKVKLADKIRAIELIGRNLAAWTDKVEHSGAVTLEDVITKSYRDVTPKADE